MKNQCLCFTLLQIALMVTGACGRDAADWAGTDLPRSNLALQAELPSAEASSEARAQSAACTHHGGRRGRILVTLPDGNRTSEAGGAVRLLVSLSSPPDGPVTVKAVSTDPGEGRPSQAVSFHPSTWWKPQTILVTGQPDDADDGDRPYRIRFTVSAAQAPHYRCVRVPEVDLINQDDDVAGLVVAVDGAAVTSEMGGEVSITLALASAPTAEVQVDVTVTDETEAMVIPTSLVFTPKHWDQPQAVHVRGRADMLADGTVPYEVVLSVASADVAYANLQARRLAFENLDGAAFAGIGHLAAGDTRSGAYGVSADGKVVVGYSAAGSTTQALRWSAETGLAPLPGVSSAARAIDASGQVIAGVAADSAGQAGVVRWVNGAGPEFLPRSPVFGPRNLSPQAISGDGKVIVGVGTWSTGPLDPVGVLWSLEHPAGDVVSAYAVITGANQDGSVLVGYTLAGRSGGPNQALRNGQALPLPTSSPSCDEACWRCVTIQYCPARAWATSRDGTVTVGAAAQNSQNLTVAVAWGWASGDAATVLSSGQMAEALAVSGNGSIVVGYENDDQAVSAMRWTRGRADKLADLLVQAGVAMNGWTLSEARGASDDGRVIIGQGVSPEGTSEGWIAVLPR